MRLGVLEAFLWRSCIAEAAPLPAFVDVKVAVVRWLSRETEAMWAGRRDWMPRGNIAGGPKQVKQLPVCVNQYCIAVEGLQTISWCDKRNR